MSKVLARKRSIKDEARVGSFSNTVRQGRIRRSESFRESSIRRVDPEEKTLLMRFVESKFHSIECRFFSKIKDGLDVDDESTICMCGEKKKHHKIDLYPFNKVPLWSEQLCMEVLPTDTYGKIMFVGEDNTNTKLTDFVRLSYRDKMEDVLDLLFNYWKIKVGTLCISVIGGSKNLKLRKKEKNIFCQGLIKAAKTTGALILTSGLNIGINKVVGDAIQDSQSYLYDKQVQNHTICCLGITSWGNIKNRKSLKMAQGKTIQYKVSDEIKPQKAISLNKNHTHYLFVDEGRRLKFSKTKAVKFRAVLEKQLSQQSDSRDDIPVVLLVVEGGHNVFHEASRSIKENVPVVICEGTGRASDILGEAYRELHRISDKNRRNHHNGIIALSEEYKKKLKKKIIEQNISEESQLNEAIKYIEEIIQNEYLITLFDMKSRDDLDLHILYSLIKKMDYMSDSNQSTISSQLSLCLLWNRVDIVKDKIFSGDISLLNEEWTALLKESILNGRLEFIELFVQNVATIDQFLTTSILRELYTKCPKSKPFRETFSRLFGRPFSNELTDVQSLLSKIVGHYENPSFLKTENMQNPFKELFIWAVLMEKHESAKFFWERCDESLSLALVASLIYKCHMETSAMDTDRIKTLIEWKNFFENLAVKLVEECYDIDQETAVYLIEKENTTWGGITCLEIAYKANDQCFISSFVCQNSLNFSWRGGFNINYFHCLLCIIFPFLLKIQPKYTKNIFLQEIDQKQSFGDGDDNERGLINASTLKKFYLAPQTKFCIHSLTFFIFLMYFSYVVLYGMKRMILTNHEIIFMAYLSLMILDKFLEVIFLKSDKMKDSFQYWWNFNHWNKIDILIMVFAVTSMLLRLPIILNISYENKIIIYRCSKTFYSIIVGLFYIKCLRLLTFHKNLGPKLVMMIKLLQELFIYMIILMIFLLSYGITSQATYYPQRDFSWLNFSNVFDYNFWTFFGVLNLGNTVYLNWCNDSNITNDCAERNFVIPILFAAYVTISNILLINVLIATFSYICNEIHKNSIQIWKFTMYSLVIEYQMKSILPLPFSMVLHLFRVLIFCYEKYLCNNLKNRESFKVSNAETKKSLNIQNLSKSASLLISSDMYIKSELDKLVKYFENNSQKCVVKEMSTKTHNSTASGILRMEFRSKSMFRELGTLQTKLEKLRYEINQSTYSNDSEQILIENDQLSPSATSKKEHYLSELQANMRILLKELNGFKFGDNKETRPKKQNDSTFFINENGNNNLKNELISRNREIIKKINSVDTKLNQFKQRMRESFLEIESLSKVL